MKAPPISPTSALYWLPRLKSLNRAIPPTYMIKVPFEKLCGAMDGKWEDIPMKEIEEAAEKLGYPIFLRTDLASAKHSGPDYYRVEKKEDLKGRIARTIDDNLCKDQFPNALLLRRFIPLNFRFVAFGGHPIAREFRFFVKKGQNICHHFYWPKAAMVFHGEAPKDWEHDLEYLGRELSVADLRLLNALSRRVGQSLPMSESWSVDFAEDVQNHWWLIDMAVAKLSWHTEDCPNFKDFREE